MNSKRGFFIVLEGSDGSGKTTQADRLKKALVRKGYRCLVTEEPGGTRLGKKIRELLLNPRFIISSRAELFLFLADRAQHVERVIAPAIDEGMVVVCSRYFYSTLVYQGLARNLASIEFLESINLFAVNEIVPDVVFYIDREPEVGLQKATQRSFTEQHYEGGDRIEKEGVDFQKRVRMGYLELAKRYEELFVVIDGNRSISAIHENLYHEVLRRIKQ